MPISLFWVMKTDDFESWLNPDPDALAAMFQEQGVLSHSLHRGADDPNSAMAQMEFADRDALEEFETWYAVAKVEFLKQAPGSAHEVVERWVGHEVPGYARRIG